MRIGVVLVRVLLVAGLAATVASPSFVDRRAPGFAELFERLRAGDATITYRRSFTAGGSPVQLIPAGEGTVRLAKSGDSYLRIDVLIPPFQTHGDRFSTLITPKSATYCMPGAFAKAASLPACITGSPMDRDLMEQLITEVLVVPRPLERRPPGSDQRTRAWPRQRDRVVLAMRSSCFRGTLEPYEGTFEVCLTERGDPLYASVDDGHGERALEATSIEHSVDTSLFDTKEFLNED